MFDCLDLQMLQHFADQQEQSEQPEAEEKAETTLQQEIMEHIEMNYSAEDGISMALELEMLEKSLGKLADRESEDAAV